MAEARTSRVTSWLRNSDILVAVGVIAVIVMFIIPMPTFLLDFLIAVNIATSLVVLLTVMYVPRAIDFSIFPTLILLTTVFRIALNVSSTRLILLEGKSFDGKIIKAFGDFVVGGNYVIGLIIFLILIAVQIVVVTKGATRVSEVAARFTLDALPGKQMEITNELQAGLINEEEAKQKKEDVQKEANFYGAMDGGSKFVQGDVRVGLIITFINIIGGLIIGTTQQGMSLGQAAEVFLTFTVGDGLVSQIPSLLLSVATGVIVTRSVSSGSLGDDLTKELVMNPKPLFIAASFLMVLSFFPGFPMLSLWFLALLFGGLAYYVKVNGPIFAGEKKEEEEEQAGGEAPSEDVYGLINIDPMELEIGFNLVPLVDPSQGGDLLDRIKLIRKTMAMELGLIVPPIRIRDNMRLSPNEYSLKIKGIEVGHGKLKIDRYLAIPPGPDAPDIPGEEGMDPVYQTRARWITEENRNEAEKNGYSVVDCPSVVATHLTEVIRRNGYELLGRQEVKKILDSVRQEYGAVVDEVMKSTNLGNLQNVFQNLLKEGVSIRNIVTILETISDYAPSTSNVDVITEKVRARLGKQIIQQIQGDSDKLYVLTLAPELENQLEESLQETEMGFVSSIHPETTQAVLEDISRFIEKIGYTVTPVVVCGERIRSLVRSIVESKFSKVHVVSYIELSGAQAKVEHMGVIKGELEESNIA
jgi:flagellar biosynthesis protein FlhA